MKFLLILFLVLQIVYAKKGVENYYAMKKVAYRYFEARKSAKAIAYVKAFAQKHPESDRAKNLLAHFYYWTGQKEAAKEILEKIVPACGLTEAKRLLKRLNRHRTGSTKKSPKPKNISDDLAFLLAYTKTHPADIENRKFLLHYFISVENLPEAERLASEILEVNPDDLETLMLVKERGLKVMFRSADRQLPKERVDALVSLLNRYYAQKAYRRFINLYRVLEHQGIFLPEYIHVDAVKVSVALEEYYFAKKILLAHELEQDSRVDELQGLVDHKLNVAASDAGSQPIL